MKCLVIDGQVGLFENLCCGIQDEIFVKESVEVELVTQSLVVDCVDSTTDKLTEKEVILDIPQPHQNSNYSYTCGDGVINSNFIKIVEAYKDSCVRIIERPSNTLLVETNSKTLYFNSKGENEMKLKPNLGLMPSDRVIVSHKEYTITDAQSNILKNINPPQYVHRPGDANIYILESKTIAVNPLGWVLDYEQPLNYSESDIYTLSQEEGELSETEDSFVESSVEPNLDTSEVFVSNPNNLNVGDIVSFVYKDESCVGKITRIYNNGDTVNILWDNKSTAFYYKSVSLVTG